MFLYGKHFSRMYQGSMVGAGFGPYAVMGYVVSNQQPNSDGRFTVDLNPVLLAATFGEPQGKIEAAIEYLCLPDPKTTTPGQEGRRLVKEGSFTYWVVNGAMYAKIRNEEERREQNRIAQQNHRAKKKAAKKGEPITGEVQGVAALNRGDEATADHLAAQRRVSGSGASNEAGKMDTAATAGETAAKAIGRPSTSGPRLPVGLRSPPAAPQSTRATISPSNPAPQQVPASSASSVSNPLPARSSVALPSVASSSVPAPPPARPAVSGGGPGNSQQIPPRGLKTSGQALARAASGLRNNPLAGGWQEAVIGTGTAAPAPSLAAGSQAPAAAHSPNSPESSEEEPPTE